MAGVEDGLVVFLRALVQTVAACFAVSHLEDKVLRQGQMSNYRKKVTSSDTGADHDVGEDLTSRLVVSEVQTVVELLKDV